MAVLNSATAATDRDINMAKTVRPGARSAGDEGWIAVTAALGDDHGANDTAAEAAQTITFYSHTPLMQFAVDVGGTGTMTMTYTVYTQVSDISTTVYAKNGNATWTNTTQSVPQLSGVFTIGIGLHKLVCTSATDSDAATVTVYARNI